ncbi:MAG: hypothetical protein ACT4QE_26275 [Anaerolineales bacterium]
MHPTTNKAAETTIEATPRTIKKVNIAQALIPSKYLYPITKAWEGL